MCGLTGVVLDPPRDRLWVAGLVSVMLSSVAHRGPDDLRLLAREHFAAGCARLEIVGGARGAQPIESSCSGTVLVCNGEVYNADDLATALRAEHQFTGTSDCEVILHAFEERGPDAFADLRGQFAFALLDHRRERLFLGRDRFGIHPLTFAPFGEGLAFASEAKALVVAGVASGDLDERGIVEAAISYGPEPPRTAFKGVSQVPPGSAMEFDFAGRLVATYDLGKRASRASAPEPTHAVRDVALEATLRRAVLRRLRGPSPAVVYVSGGIDSAAVAYMAREVRASHLTLVGIRFPTMPSLDESSAQAQVARDLGLSYRPLDVLPEHIWDVLGEVVAHAEVPLPRLGPAPMFLLARAARGLGARFALSGEGADELLLGYPVFEKAVSSVEAKRAQSAALVRCFRGMEGDATSFLDDVGVQPEPDRTAYERARAIEVETKLSRYLLGAQGDRVAMAHGLELRYPFLDEEFWDDSLVAARRPDGKAVLRRLLGGHVSAPVISRSKRGYFAPSETPPALFEGPLARALIEDASQRPDVWSNGLFVPKTATQGQGGTPWEAEVAQATTILLVTTKLLLEAVADWQASRSIRPRVA